MTQALLDALKDTPAILLHGARQVGKTTLARELLSAWQPTDYVTFDNAATLSIAQSDPIGFLAGLGDRVILDEIQRVPELFPAIKMSIDQHRVPGRFLLTGSANVLLVPRLSESLAGRMEILTLWPLSQGEIMGIREGFVDALFSDSLSFQWNTPLERSDLIRRMLAGGYPEPSLRIEEKRRYTWFNSYITTILQRDVRDLANIEGLTVMPQLLSLLASRTASILNVEDISRSTGISRRTLNRYITLLQAIFLITTLPAWYVNIGKRLVKSPKMILNDTGLIGGLLNLNEERLTQNNELLGQILENFVVIELCKQIGWSQTQPKMYHFRIQEGAEADIVLEAPSGQVAGIEVKLSATINERAFKGLKSLAEAAGNRFVRGVVLYTGTEKIPHAHNLHAIPIQALWQTEFAS